MQSNHAIGVVTPLGGGISEVTSLPDASAVLAGVPGVLVEQRPVFHATVRHESSCENDLDAVVRSVEIHVIGRDREIAGVLRRNLPLTAAAPSAPLPQDEDTAIVDEATSAFLHDIKNLLATIDYGLRLLEHQTEAEGRQLIIRRMRQAVECGAVSSRKLLRRNPIQQSGDTDITTRRDLVAVADDLLYAVAPGRSLHTAIAEDLSDFAADPRDLYFALLNLCHNASAALHVGGEIVISATNIVPRPGAPTGAVEIIVADNGRGMPKEVLRRAFDANFTTKPVGEGSGLGLSQVERFVHRSDGAIEITSEVGVGTTVRMMLPGSTSVNSSCVDLSNYLPGRNKTTSSPIL